MLYRLQVMEKHAVAARLHREARRQSCYKHTPTQQNRTAAAALPPSQPPTPLAPTSNSSMSAPRNTSPSNDTMHSHHAYSNSNASDKLTTSTSATTPSCDDATDAAVECIDGGVTEDDMMEVPVLSGAALAEEPSQTSRFETAVVRAVKPQEQVWLRKVLVTPLRVLPYPETPEESNRILRQCVICFTSGVLSCYAMVGL
jgi:hypothetical protein